jgi:HAD superfamily hydrolase (TIGR01509 family)
MIRAVLFDMDGVILEGPELHRKALSKALKHVCGFDISKQEHDLRFNGLPTKVKTSMLLIEGRIKESDIVKINKIKQKFTLELSDKELSAQEKQVKSLKHIRALGIHTACVTNSIRKTTMKMLQKTLGTLKYLDLIITNEDVSKPKPDPEGYLAAMKYFKVTPAETLILEDSLTGLQSAYSSGAQVFEVKNIADVKPEYFQNLITDYKKYPIR